MPELVRIINKNLVRYGQVGKVIRIVPAASRFFITFADGTEHCFLEGEFEFLNPDPQLPTLMGLAEVAAHLKITTSRISRLRRDPRFPEPIAILRQGAVWDAKQIRAFMPRPVGRPVSDSDPQ